MFEDVLDSALMWLIDEEQEEVAAKQKRKPRWKH
jgi:hypothetical protein